MQLIPYLHFQGNCEEAFKFYEKVFGGKIESIMPFEGAPPSNNVPADWGKKIMHATMSVEGQTLMGSDAPPKYFERPQGFRVTVNLKDMARAKKIYDALSQDGKITMAFAQTFWSPGFAMFEDRFGIPWMINCE